MEHKQALLDGFATGLGTIGVLGFAINAQAWPLLLLFIGMSLALPIISRKITNKKG